MGQVQLGWTLNIFKTNFLGDGRTLDVNCSVEPIVVLDLELLENTDDMVSYTRKNKYV